MVTVKALFTLLWFSPYVIIMAPIEMGLDPVTKGTGYMETILPLQLGMCTIYFLLYSFVPYAAYLLLTYILRSDEPILKCIVVGYLVFYAAAVVISVLSTLIISSLIRPLWALQARRNM